MTSIRVTQSRFQEGDEVVLARGTYPGTLGVFVHLNEDSRWADVRERDGEVRSHPVAWLAHAVKVNANAKN